MRELIISVSIIAIFCVVIRVVASVTSVVVTSIDLYRSKKYKCLVTPNQMVVCMWSIWLFVSIVLICTFLYAYMNGNSTITTGHFIMCGIMIAVAVFGIVYYYSSSVYIDGTFIHCNRLVFRKKASLYEVYAKLDEKETIRIFYNNGKKFAAILGSSEGYDGIVEALKDYNALSANKS